MATLPLNHDARHDRYWAGGVSAGLHLLALLWTLTAASTLSEGSSARDTTSGQLSMTFLGEDEFRQPLVIAKTTPQAERPDLIPVEPLSDTSPNPQAPTAVAVAESPEVPSSAPSPPTATMTAPNGGEAGMPVERVESPLPAFPPYGREHDYLMALREAIRAQWAPGTGPCSITIQQTVGGRVVAAVSESCAMGVSAKQALEAAALSAQPLPYAGFERVFRERVTLSMGM